MKKILSLIFFISTFVVVTFLLFQDAESYMMTKLEEPGRLGIYSALSFVFLLSDILLPIPSSLIMILNGKLLGFMGGTLLSFIAGLTSSSIGYFLGRASKKYLDRFFKPKEIESANAFMDKYGKLSIALSRAIPILSETIAVMTGTTNITFKTFFSYSVIGHIVVSMVYAWVGAFASSLNGHVITVVVVIATLILSVVFGKITSKKLEKKTV
jgi:uncharacterized membrane protein YdjX (TVP38/TMEM64 family)